MRKRLSLNLIWLMILFVIPLPLVISLNQQLTASNRDLIVYDLGVFAYAWWLVSTYLALRPKWLDRLIGLPDMYLIHGLLGTLSLLAATLHKFLSFSFDQNVKNTGNIAWYLVVFGFFYAVLFLSGWLVNYFALAARLKQHLSPVFRHQVSVWIHRLNLVAIGLIFLHVHLIVRISSVSPFMFLFNAYSGIVLLLYVGHKLRRLPVRGTVVTNQPLATDTQQVVIQSHHPKDAYQAGDFYFIAFKGLGNEAHPFSVSSAPGQTPGRVTFTIQNAGDFTGQVAQVPVNTLVRLEGPFGLFNPTIQATDATQPLILYGLGTGIAPLLSLAQAYAGTHPISVIWVVHDPDQLYYSEQFKALAAQHANFKYFEKVHRLTPTDLQEHLTSSELTQGNFYIVGPARAVITIEDQLATIGVHRRRLHDERLTL